jgi:hypothetical protein
MLSVSRAVRPRRSRLSSVRAFSRPGAAAQSDTLGHSKSLIVGERLEYDVKFGPFKVGRASMEVMDVEEVRGRRAWHTRFQVTGGTLFFRVDDVLESWIDVETFSALRFRQQLSEGTRDRLNEYEIYPEQAVYVEEEGRTAERLTLRRRIVLVLHSHGPAGARRHVRVPAVLHARPQSRSPRGPWPRYVDLPAGRFDALVIRPVIKAKGIFSEDGRAQVWISNDADHLVLQMTSHLKFGSLSLHLKSRKLLDTASEADNSHRGDHRALNSGRPPEP